MTESGHAKEGKCVLLNRRAACFVVFPLMLAFLRIDWSI